MGSDLPVRTSFSGHRIDARRSSRPEEFVASGSSKMSLFNTKNAGACTCRSTLPLSFLAL